MGIHEAEPSFIAHQKFRELLTYHGPPPGGRQPSGRLVRAIFPWYVAKPIAPHRAWVRHWLERWLDEVRAIGATPLVTFNVGSRKPRSTEEFADAFSQFKQDFGPGSPRPVDVSVIAPWNEPNRKKKQTFISEERAASFFRAAKLTCPECTLVAAEFAGNRSKPQVRYFKRYLRKIKRFLRSVGDPNPPVIGVHTQADVQRFQICSSKGKLKEVDRGIKRLRRRNRKIQTFNAKRYCGRHPKGIRAEELRVFREVVFGEFPKARMWLTEIPTYRRLKFRGVLNVDFNNIDHCRATAFVQTLPNQDPKRRIDRVYFYRFWEQIGDIHRTLPKDGNDRGLLPQNGVAPLDAFGNVKFLDPKCRPHLYATAFVASTTPAWLTQHGGRTGTEVIADANGDGAADAVVYRDGTWEVATSAGNAFNPPAQWLSNHRPGAEKPMMDDVDGDDRADAVAFDEQDGSWYVASSTGGSFAPTDPPLWISGHGVGESNVMLSDVNRDGMSDAVVFFKSDGSWYVALSTGRAFAPPSPTPWISDHGRDSEEQLMDDLDGDDLPDAVVYDAQEGTWDVARSNGSAFETPPVRWANRYGMGFDKQMLDDVTGDNMADAIVYRESDGTWEVRPSVGSRFGDPDPWLSGFGIGPSRHFVADATGDDKGDAVVVYADSGDWYVRPATP